jgi:Fe-S metabolism associated domain
VLDSRANGNKMTLDTIRSDFEFLDDWEDRYRYVIELGRGLPPLPEAYRTDPAARCGSLEIRAILILKFRLESADRPIANIDSALYGAIIDPRPFKAQPALEHALVVRHHLLKELRHSGLAGVFLGKLGESKNGFEREVTLGGRLFLSGGHMKVLAANATLLPSDAEHPE